MSSGTAFETIIDALRAKGCEVKADHGRGKSQCPAHDDTSPSLSINPRRDGKGAVLKCHAGCDTPDVVAAVGLTMGDLFDEPKVRAIYQPRRDYRYPGGRVVHRKPGKSFPQSGDKDHDRTLFGSESITADTAAVYVVEGEKDVEAVQAAGGVAVCSAMGAGKAHLADWSALAGKGVVIVADRDGPGRKHAAQVTELLRGIAASVVLAESVVGKDFADHYAAGFSLDDLVPLGDQASTGQEITRPPGDLVVPSEKPRRSVAAQLVDLARAHYRLGVTEAGDAFGVSVEQPHIALMLRGGKAGLRAELARRFFAETNTVAGQQALADALAVLEGFAAQEEPQRVYLRAAESAGRVYIDTGDTAGTVIEIGAGTWLTTDAAPVLFRRTKLTGPLPQPQRGGDLATLWNFVGIDQADQPLVLAVLVAALIHVDVPHVILVLLAEQGSAKSTATRILVSLIDPSAVPLRQPPRDPDGWTTAAAASWVVALDNLSGDIPAWLSDCLCRASTGDGRVTRALYTDSDVSVLAFRRCIIANGIDIVVDKGDLAERVAVVGLPRVKARRSEDELADAWETARPAVFGALLDLSAEVHRRLPTVSVDDLPRMADFAKVLAAVDDICDTKGLDRYRKRAQHAAAETLDVPFIAELLAAGKPFVEASSAELLAALKPAGPDWKPPRGWPRNARAVTGLLTRHAPALRQQGWAIDNDVGHNHANRVQWSVTPPSEPEKAGIPDSRDSPDSHAQVNGHKSRESARELGIGDTGLLTRANSHDSHNSQPGRALTCEDELASHASHENTPSLVCTECGFNGVPVGRALHFDCERLAANRTNTEMEQTR